MTYISWPSGRTSETVTWRSVSVADEATRRFRLAGPMTTVSLASGGDSKPSPSAPVTGAQS